MWDSVRRKKQSIRYAENFSSAIRANGLKNAVFLSSYGTHRLHDAGAISGMGLAEVVLNVRFSQFQFRVTARPLPA
jgi:hypothetical protein